MAGKKRRYIEHEKDRKKKNIGRSGVLATEKCCCPCHNPETRYLIFHCAPCCGSCHCCGEKRIKILCLDAHREKCREVVEAGRGEEKQNERL